MSVIGCRPAGPTPSSAQRFPTCAALLSSAPRLSVRRCCNDRLDGATHASGVRRGIAAAAGLRSGVNDVELCLPSRR